MFRGRCGIDEVGSEYVSVAAVRLIDLGLVPLLLVPPMVEVVLLTLALVP